MFKYEHRTTVIHLEKCNKFRQATATQFIKADRYYLAFIDLSMGSFLYFSDRTEIISRTVSSWME